MSTRFITPAAGPFSYGHDLHSGGTKVARFSKIQDARAFEAVPDLIKAVELLLGALDPRLEAPDKPAYLASMREIAQAALTKAGVARETEKAA
jgi:hypothetical protein